MSRPATKKNNMKIQIKIQGVIHNFTREEMIVLIGQCERGLLALRIEAITSGTGKIIEEALSEIPNKL